MSHNEQASSSLEGCSGLSRHTNRDTVEKLLSLINLESSRKVSKREEDFSLLKLICKAKLEVLASNPLWSMQNYTAMLLSKVLNCIDMIDAEAGWEMSINKHWYSELQKAIAALKHHNPHWRFEEHDYDKYSICPECNTIKSSKKKLLTNVEKKDSE